jgi:subtilisin family serine protease
MPRAGGLLDTARPACKAARVRLGVGTVLLLAVVAATTATGAAGRDAQRLQSKALQRQFVPGEVLVRFKPGVDRTGRAAVLQQTDTIRKQWLRLPGAELLQLPREASVESAVHELESRPEVLYAEPNFIYHATLTPNDPRYGELWGLSQPSDADIDGPQAWDFTTGSSAVTVAVVDTGVAYDHPDLAPNMLPGYDFVDNDSDPRDENGHGTHVAGTIGAAGNNGLGVTGVNWDVGLMPVRVLDEGGSGTNDQVTNGFAYAAANGAKVVNASLGGSFFSQAMKDAIDAAAGTLFVVAAGNAADDNDFIPTYPCNYASANLICVAATTQADDLASFSNYGLANVDLAAPGTEILSTWPAYDSLFTDGFETAGIWTAGGAPETWARTQESSLFGSWSATDSPGTLYEDFADNWFRTTNPINLGGRHGCNVRYALKYQTEEEFDFFVVDGSTDASEWFEVGAHTGETPNYPNSWTLVEEDLTDFDDESTFYLRFGFESDESFTFEGAHVDAVTVRCIGTNYNADDYNSIQGTSMATPHVAGATALLLAQKPPATVAELRAALLGSVDVLPALAGKVATSGRLNAYGALVALSGGPPPPPLEPPPPSPPPPSATPPPPPSPSPPPAIRPPTPVRCAVPNVKRKTVAQARRLLASKRCALGRIRRAYSVRVRRGRIISQSRRVGVRLPRGTRVGVVVSRGRRR